MSDEGGTSLSAAKGVAGRDTTPFAALRDVPPLLAYCLVPCALPRCALRLDRQTD